MSREPYEPYEVSLGNTQIAAFAALLVLAMVGAFAAGAWWGRSNAGDADGAQEGGAVVSGPALLPSEAMAAAAETAPAEVVRFFGAADDDEDAAAGGEAAARGEAAGEGASVDEDEAAGQGEAVDEAQAGGEARAGAEAGDAAEDETGAETAAAAVDVSGPAAGTAGLVVQVFSSADAAQAASVERRLVADGHRAFLSPQTLDGQVMQRVRVGPFDDRAAAAAVAEQLSRQYGLETWITPNN